MVYIRYFVQVTVNKERYHLKLFLSYVHIDTIQWYTVDYLANSSMRLAIRRLSSGQRSFKQTRLLAPLVSEITCVLLASKFNKY